MIQRTLSFLDQLNITIDIPLLLSVSGGMDSMVLLDLLYKQGYNIEVAHINHGTRDGESDKDEAFVAEQCKQKNISFHSIKLDYNTLSNGNFQENARLARKSFLDKIYKERNLKYIVTAHHADDNFESFMMNLQRGSGLNGMRGIRAINLPYIRPMLSLRRKDIESYQSLIGVEYREDESNNSDDYLRNRVRHHIVPSIEEVLPSVIEATQKTTSILGDELLLLEKLVEIQKKHICSVDNDIVTIDLEQVFETPSPKAFLYYILKEYSIDYKLIEDIYKAKTGAVVSNNAYEILKDRNTLKIRPKKEVVDFSIKINDYGVYETPFGEVYISNIATKDIQKHLLLPNVKFPLTLRPWKAGDYFKPDGMKGRSKKIKKFLTDQKLSLFEKERVMVLLEDDKIIQVVGYRNGLK